MHFRIKLQVAIDSGLVAERWGHFDFHSPAVASMSRALAPAYLRLGGNAADLLVFDPEGVERNSDLWRNETALSNRENLADLFQAEKHKNATFYMTGDDWKNFNGLASKAGWKVLFDVNVLLRKKGQPSAWDETNARKLLAFSAQSGFTDLAFELGNEPNGFRHEFNVTLPPAWLGKDFTRLRRLLDSFPEFKGSTLVGPDINQVYNCYRKK